MAQILCTSLDFNCQMQVTPWKKVDVDSGVGIVMTLLRGPAMHALRPRAHKTIRVFDLCALAQIHKL